MIFTEEDKQKQRRFAELAERSYMNGRHTFTDFLGMSELDLLLRMKSELDYAGITLFGGTDGCERVIARFGEDDGTDDFPIVCVEAKPAEQKFADPLTHRDLLGALMNLEIAREKIGDIFLQNNVAYLFCSPSVAPVILSELKKAKHTTLRCSVVEALPDGVSGKTEEKFLQVASLRADVLVAGVFKLSREESLELFRARRVFADGRLLENNSAAVAEGQTLSVRGFGRFRFQAVHSMSKKGKYNITVELSV